MAFVKEKRLTVRSVITRLTASGAPDGEDEVTELQAPAMLKEEADGLSFTYTEQSEDARTVCHVTVTDTAVTVCRRGASVCDMHFGETDDEGVYEVPPYRFPMTLHTLKLRPRLTADGGTLDIFYRMNLGGDERKVHLRMTLT